MTELQYGYFDSKKSEKWVDKLIELSAENLSDNAFEILLEITELIPDIWNKSASSTMKYHVRKDGHVPSIAEHTYAMTRAGIKIMRMFPDSEDIMMNDARITAIILHDGLKYGENGKSKHTTRNHDYTMGEFVLSEDILEVFRKYYSEKAIVTIFHMIRYHSGIWSIYKKYPNAFTFDKFPPEVVFIHMLDMLDTQGCLSQTGD